MPKELRDLLEQINNKKQEAKALLDSGKLEEAKALASEAEKLKEVFNLKQQLLEDEKEKIEMPKPQNKAVENMEMKAFMNTIKNKPLDEEMKAALRTSSDADGGVLVPSEVASTINEVKRQYTSLKDYFEVIPVTSAKGTLPVEDASSMQNLVDFDEVSDFTEQQPSFKAVTYALKNKGAITPISNALLQDETAGLPAYVVRHFGKKAVRTENADGLTLLAAGKAKKSFANIADVKKAMNKELDPAILGEGAAVITNQDGYHHLDQEVDSQGRPLLQPSVANPDQKTFKGLPIVVLSNAELATTGTTTKKAPMFIGNFKEAVKFFDRGVYEVAVGEDFKKNQTLMRCIERYDVKLGDVDAYINGEIDVTASI